MATDERSTRARATAVLSDPQVRELLYLYLAIKGGLLLVAYLGSQFLPFNWQLYNTNLVTPMQEGLSDLFRPLNTWDTQQYLLLATRGYGVNPMSNAFYPLYPFLIWAFTPLFFNKGLIAAWVIANLISLAIPVYMFKLCSLFWTREQAYRATLVLLAFPTAFFFSTAYSEALYLAICLGAFYYLYVQDTTKATVLCFLFPLARAQALLFLAPMGVMFLETWLRGPGTRSERLGPALRRFAPPAAATVLGMVVYFGFCQWKLGDFMGGLAAQQLYVSDNALGHLFQINRWFMRNFVDIQLHLHSYSSSIIDRVAFVLCAPLLVGIYRTQNKAFFVYAVTTLVIPALAGTFMSYTRVLLVVFPLAVFLGTSVKRWQLIAAPMFILQVLLYLLHTGSYWVA